MRCLLRRVLDTSRGAPPEGFAQNNQSCADRDDHAKRQQLHDAWRFPGLPHSQAYPCRPIDNGEPSGDEEPPPSSPQYSAHALSALPACPSTGGKMLRFGVRRVWIGSCVQHPRIAAFTPRRRTHTAPPGRAGPDRLTWRYRHPSEIADRHCRRRWLPIG